MAGGEQQPAEASWQVEAGLRELGALGGRVIVVLDDLDRLTEGEVLPSLRFLRIVADPPFVTIIVAMDERRLRDFLEKGEVKPKEMYLDKFVTW